MKKILLLLFILPVLCYSQADNNYDSLKAAIDNDEHESALHILEDILSRPYVKHTEFSEGKLHSILVALYRETGDQDAYIKSLHEGIGKFPTDTTMIELYLSDLLKKDDEETIDKFIDESLVKYPKHEGVFLFLKGRMYLIREDFLSGEIWYDKLLEQEPNNGQANMDIGYYSMQYANKLYKSWKTDIQTKETSKEEIVKYYRKAADCMITGYEFAPENAGRVKQNILYFANEAVIKLEEMGENIDKYTEWSRKMGFDE